MWSTLVAQKSCPSWPKTGPLALPVELCPWFFQLFTFSGYGSRGVQKRYAKWLKTGPLIFPRGPVSSQLESGETGSERYISMGSVCFLLVFLVWSWRRIRWQSQSTWGVALIPAVWAAPRRMGTGCLQECLHPGSQYLHPPLPWIALPNRPTKIWRQINSHFG